MPSRDNNTERPLLILDLDEALIHPAETPLAHPPSFQTARYDVYERPFAHELLEGTAPWFKTTIWSSASLRYVEIIVDKLIGDRHELAFVWSAEQCTQRRDLELDEWFYAKNLEPDRHSQPSVMIQ